MVTDSALRTVAHNVVHLRASSSNDSGRVSQLLLGQTVRVLREENDWLYIEGEDTYRGWADNRHLIPHEEVEREPVQAVFADLRQEPDHRSPLVMRLPQLAGVQILSATENGFIEVQTPGGKWHGYLGATNGVLPFRGLSFVPVPAEQIPAVAVRHALEFLGTPYLWGGSSSFGLDCSGLVQYCYRIARITLRRDADIQRTDPRFVSVPVGEVTRAGNDLLPGDLVFFGTPERITHVGMHLTGNKFIHSAGGLGVTIAEWESDRYSAKFVDARRLDFARANDPVTRFESETR